MHEAGLRRGIGVGVLLPLTPQAYAAHLAAHALGCRVAPARPAWGPEQLAFALTKVDVVLAERPMDVAKPTLLLSDLLDGKPWEVLSARPEDPARLIFTSGSTGRPKACAHSYRAMSLAYQREHWPPPTRLMTHFRRCLVHQSLAAPVQFTYLGRCLVAGGSAVLPDEPGGPELDLAATIERLRPTATMMHPARAAQRQQPTQGHQRDRQGPSNGGGQARQNPTAEPLSVSMRG